jgi:hypothetical protein
MQAKIEKKLHWRPITLPRRTGLSKGDMSPLPEPMLLERRELHEIAS